MPASPSRGASPAPHGTHAARVVELEGEIRGLRRKVLELSQALATSDEERRRLRETLDGSLHQVELQTLIIDELRLEVDAAHAKLSQEPAETSVRIPPVAPPRPLDAKSLTLADLLPLAQGAGEQLKTLQAEGATVDAELRVLRQAIEFLKTGQFWEAQVVLHGLRVALDQRHHRRRRAAHAASLEARQAAAVPVPPVPATAPPAPVAAEPSPALADLPTASSPPPEPAAAEDPTAPAPAAAPARPPPRSRGVKARKSRA